MDILKYKKPKQAQTQTMSSRLINNLKNVSAQANTAQIQAGPPVLLAACLPSLFQFSYRRENTQLTVIFSQTSVTTSRLSIRFSVETSVLKVFISTFNVLFLLSSFRVSLFWCLIPLSCVRWHAASTGSCKITSWVNGLMRPPVFRNWKHTFQRESLSGDVTIIREKNCDSCDLKQMNRFPCNIWTAASEALGRRALDLR